jgi:hypothetical protein
MTCTVKPVESCTPTPGTYAQKMAGNLPYNLRPIARYCLARWVLKKYRTSAPGKASWLSGEKTKVKQSGQD